MCVCVCPTHIVALKGCLSLSLWYVFTRNDSHLFYSKKASVFSKSNLVYLIKCFFRSWLKLSRTTLTWDPAELSSKINFNPYRKSIRISSGYVTGEKFYCQPIIPLLFICIWLVEKIKILLLIRDKGKFPLNPIPLFLHFLTNPLQLHEKTKYTSTVL